MRVLILSLLPIVGFAVGSLLARRRTPDNRRLERDYNRLVQKHALAEEALDDLSFMASDHAALGEPGGVLMGERIQEYRKARRNEG